jgi:hypothetical protein
MKDFHIVSHIMVGTQRSQMPKKLYFCISYDVMLEYIYAKNIYVTMYLNMQIC